MCAASLPEGTVVGRYLVRDLLGSGGMGEVYFAWDETLDRAVALKILPTELMRDPHRVQRFLTEAKAASALNHPAIVTVYETGRHPLDAEPAESTHFIAMELIEGVTLDKWMKKGPPLETVLSQLAQVAEGLAKAHARGIVHRDLKPGNIMISTDGHAKVLDFGLAKLLEAERNADGSSSDSHTLTDASSRPGTAGYMAPEQIEGGALDQRADIFSFGCILYECLTGHHPFRGSSGIETLHNSVHREPPPLRETLGSGFDDLERVVRRCLAKDPERRYDSARDAAYDLLEAAAGHPSRSPLPERRTAIRAAILLLAAILAVALLRTPAGAFVDAVTGVMVPSTNPEVTRLQTLLSAEREQNHNVTVALTDREREIARQNTEIERLRAARDEESRLRADLEASYRKLLNDVDAGLRKDSKERSEIRQRIAGAEMDLQRIRSESERRSAEQARFTSIQRAMSPLVDTKLDQRGVVVTIPGAFFRKGSTRIDESAGDLIRQIASQLVDYPDLKVRVEGHTDTSGSADGNLYLSRMRAEDVRRRLIIEGVDASRISSVGRGELFPAFSNETTDGRIANRRLELILSD